MFANVVCAGTMTWSHLSLQDSSTYNYNTDLVLTASFIMMRYDSRILAESIDIVVADFHVEGDSHLDVSGRGPTAGQGQCWCRLLNCVTSGYG